ncbi:flagellar basal body rod protein FlgC [Sagittula sp. S175]|uniref:flagellar basal body rod protein FlgC n=1 Tax=Sagittula sp. S175 TaxID=3415129 RepID=UPI003C7A7081
MSAFSDALNVTTSGLRSQAARLRVTSENIANVDTPGYRRKMMAFDATRGENGLTTVAPGDVNLSQQPLEQIYDPGNPLADATGNYEGTNVDLMIEISDAREAQRSYEANLKMFDQTRQMSTALLDLLRR